MKTGHKDKDQSAIRLDQIDIDQLFAHRKSRAERETDRRAVRAAARQVAQGPLTGAWYWVPLPAGEGRLAWEVQEFFDCWASSSDHVHIWKHVIDSLRHHWQRSFAGIEYCSLPRGRVATPIVHRHRSRRPPAAAIYHGNDSPLGQGGIALVKASFNLPASTPVIFDEHEQCIVGQPEALSRALGVELGITGVGISDLDYDE